MTYYVQWKEGAAGTYADFPIGFWLSWNAGSFTFGPSTTPADAKEYYIKLRAKSSYYTASTEEISQEFIIDTRNAAPTLDPDIAVDTLAEQFALQYPVT